MEGQKFSKGKLPINTLISKQFNRAIREVARASLAGHLKYLASDPDWMNWSRVENGSEQYMNAAARHLLESALEIWNPDMEEYGGVRHKASIIWNLLASLELDLIEEEKSNEKVQIPRLSTEELIKQLPEIDPVGYIPVD